MLNRVFKRCGWCGLIVKYIDNGEPLNPYLVSLGFKKSTGNIAYHKECFDKKYPGWTEEEVKESIREARKAIDES